MIDDQPDPAHTALATAAAAWPTTPPIRARDIDTRLVQSVLGSSHAAPPGLLPELVQRLGAPAPLLELVGRVCGPALWAPPEADVAFATSDHGAYLVADSLTLLLDNASGDAALLSLLDGSPDAAFRWSGAYIVAVHDGTSDQLNAPSFVSRWLDVAPETGWLAALAGLNSRAYRAQPHDAHALHEVAASRGRALTNL